MASSLSFSLQPFFRILSQKVANNLALDLPESPLLQMTSKASLSACGKNYMRMRYHLQFYGNNKIIKKRYFQLKTLWKSAKTQTATHPKNTVKSCCSNSSKSKPTTTQIHTHTERKGERHIKNTHAPETTICGAKFSCICHIIVLTAITGE